MSLFCVESRIFLYRSVFFMRDKKNGYIYYNYHKKTEKEEIRDIAWRSVFRWLTAIIGVLFVFFLTWILFFQVIEVDGTSMMPTLNDGDRIVVSTFGYEPKTGDIVVIGAIDEDDVCLVKRVIATENQVVTMDYTDGSVIVDGVVLNEPYISEIITERREDEIKYPYTVPEGCVFVMGDNRNVSKDSRSVDIQSIDEDLVVGKAVIRLAFSSDAIIYD